MGTTTLRPFLQSLCYGSGWDYAVFWKLHHQSQMLLTWEEGYCDILKHGESMESILDNIYDKGSDEIFSLNCESSIDEGNFGGYPNNPIGQALDYMSSIQYALGDGVVGEVAYTGNYRWVFSDNVSAGELNSKLVPEFPDEWLFQFEAGIKTLLLVPVVPYGVLQLGSLETVAEDLALVAYVKDKFIAHQSFVGYFVPTNGDGEFQAQSSSSLISTFMGNFDEPSFLTMNETNSKDSMVVENVNPRSHKLSTMNQMTPPCTAKNLSHASRNDILKIDSSVTETDIGVQLVGSMEVAEPLYHFLNCNELEMMESSMFRFPCPGKELNAYSYPNYNMGVSGESTYKTMNFDRADTGIMEQPLIDMDADNTGHKNLSTFFSFPTDCELHKALGPTIMGQSTGYLQNSSITGEVAFRSSSLICNGDLIRGTGRLACETSGLFVKEDEAEHLLEAVVANACCGLDENSSDRTNIVKSSLTSSGQFAASSKGESQLERSAVVGEDTVPWSCVTSAFVDTGRNAITNSSPSASSFETVMSALIEEEEQKKAYGHPHPRKGSKQSSASKRRARLGDNPRPRPRDRQLIQDRVKVLRELVPNGAKCSIDGLLDRTVKHMLFLRSVTDQADKLRKWVHHEVTDRKNLKTTETNGGRQNGKSWGLELGSEQQICPIVVEDLAYPGQMLIEMLCNDHARFLEIAEVIHRLELTVLKGVMERRSDDTWAHFIIEAPKGFHRLDIFWPLMQLLQQNRTPISSKI